MTIAAASERRFLSHEEAEIVGSTHYPALAEADADRLRESQGRLRGLRDKAGAIARRKRRESARGASAIPDAAVHAARRKQVFSQALKRASRQLQRLDHAAARAHTARGVQKAVALKRREEAAERPGPGRHARAGMRSNPSLRRAMGVPGAKVGSVSQAGKAAQAKRDARGGGARDSA
jgi:hypothetical protein